jgi:hypothetical protein
MLYLIKIYNFYLKDFLTLLICMFNETRKSMVLYSVLYQLYDSSVTLGLFQAIEVCKVVK